MHESEFNVDPMGRVRFYGIYPAKVVNINDPLKKNRIQVQVHQITGTETTSWAESCLPVTNTAAQVASVLTTAAAVSGTSSSGNAHTHSIPALTVRAKTTPVYPITPVVGQTVWVMFIAGDPGSPVWIGVAP